MKKPSIKMVALYKCRACGTVYQKGVPVSHGIAVRNTYSLSMMDRTLEGDTVHIRRPHRCGDDAVGLADFIGYTANIDAYRRADI